MKKIIIIVLFLISLLSIVLVLTKYNDYSKITKTKSNDEEINEEIKKIDEEIIIKSKEYESIKEENEDLIKELEVWQERVAKVKSYLS